MKTRQTRAQGPSRRIRYRAPAIVVVGFAAVGAQYLADAATGDPHGPLGWAATAGVAIAAGWWLGGEGPG